MNEVTKINLGRQVFTIAADAYKELQDYLAAIRRRVGPKGADVVEEVELRIAELLAERGVTGDKVILHKDIAFIKTQLGKPGDFSDADDDTEDGDDEAKEAGAAKRLFRDPDHGMVAGVAAGLGAYLDIDVLFVRIAFIGLTLVWGWGAVVYVILWLIVPELKSKGDRLRAEGKPITVESLKHIVERADMPGAAGRLGKALRGALHSGSRVAVTALGVLFSVVGVAALLGVMTAGAYLLFRPAAAERSIFLVNRTEGVAVGLVLLALAVFCAFLLLIGLAIVRRKWTLPGWIVATIVGIGMVSIATSAGLAPGIVQDVRGRYQAMQHTVHREVPAFTKLQVLHLGPSGSGDVQATFVPSDTYSIDVEYVGNADPALITATIDHDTLVINPERFTQAPRCDWLCWYGNPGVKITVHAPQVSAIDLQGSSGYFAFSDGTRQASLSVTIEKGNTLTLMHTYADAISWDAAADEAKHTLQLTGLRKDATDADGLTLYDNLAINRVNNLTVTLPQNCWLSDSHPVDLQHMPSKLTINKTTFTAQSELQKALREDMPTAANCAQLPGVAPPAP